jgi:hypothetical protein
MYSVFIIGAGSKGALSDAPGSGNEHKFLSYAHAVKCHPAFNLAGFADILPEMKEGAERIWHPEKSDSIDVVVITTPDNAHYDHLLKAADFNCGLVICEKPLCKTSVEAAEIVELYKKKGLPLLVDYTRRFIPRFGAYKTEIQTGKYGEFVTGYLYFNRGWEHTASHFIDMCLWFGLDLDKIRFEKPAVEDFQWLYQWGLIFEKGTISEHSGMKKEGAYQTDDYDKHLYYLMDSAYQFLEQNTKHLVCTGEEALRAIQETERIKGVK